jgi:hypothetical protein
VIAEALDYARAIAGWRYEDREREVRRALAEHLQLHAGPRGHGHRGPLDLV